MKKILMVITLFTMLCLFNSKVVAYKEYKIGDIVEYNGVKYYVIKNSNTSEETITLLKAEPLTVEEVNTYGGVGTANNHVNMYVKQDISSSYYQTAYDNNGYGGMAYYSSTTCGYNGSDWLYDGCTTDYIQSEVKYVIDAWKASKAPSATETRLLTVEELINNLGYENNFTCTGSCYYSGSLKNVPEWIYVSNYGYWTMTPYNDADSLVWSVTILGDLGYGGVNNSSLVVRPVIVLKKDNLLNKEEQTNDSENKQDSKDSDIISNSEYDSKKNTDNHSKIVYVDNTASKKSVIIILIGFLLAGVGIVTYYIIMKKTEKNKL